MPVGARKFRARQAAPSVCLPNLPAVVRAKPGEKKEDRVPVRISDGEQAGVIF